jgi:hypothetical protein
LNGSDLLLCCDQQVLEKLAGLERPKQVPTGLIPKSMIWQSGALEEYGSA